MLLDSGDVMTIDELSEYLKVSKSRLYRLGQEGSLLGQKVGRHWRFYRDVVDQWLTLRLDRIRKQERDDSKKDKR